MSKCVRPRFELDYLYARVPADHWAHIRSACSACFAVGVTSKTTLQLMKSAWGRVFVLVFQQLWCSTRPHFQRRDLWPVTCRDHTKSRHTDVTDESKFVVQSYKFTFKHYRNRNKNVSDVTDEASGRARSNGVQIAVTLIKTTTQWLCWKCGRYFCATSHRRAFCL